MVNYLWKMTTSYVKDNWRSQVSTIPQQHFSAKETSPSTNQLKLKETTFPIRHPEGNQLGATQSVWLGSLETKGKVFPTCFLLSFLGGAWETKTTTIGVLV